MFYATGQSYCKEFVTSHPTTGAATNADSLPVATANRNGTDDAAFSLTVTNIDAGRYKITGTVPAYSDNDVVNVSVAATVNAIAAKGIVDTFTVKTVSTYAGGAVASVSAAVTVGTNNDKTGYALSVAPPTAAAISTAVWGETVRSLTTFGSLTADTATAVWGASVRSLTTFGSLVADVATAVWGAVTRTLTTTIPTAVQIRQEIDTNSTKLDAAISTRLASAGYTAPDNTSITGIKAKTDQLQFTGAAVNANATVDTGAIATAVAGAISVPTVGQIDAQLSSTHGAGSWGSSAVGTGSVSVTLTITADGSPIDGVAVYVTTDAAGTSITAGTLYTNAFGHVTFQLDPGTYYVWKQCSGYNFTNPETTTVTA